jgi:hypothetical protein
MSSRSPTSATTTGRRLVLRNGYQQPREVLTAAGAVEVTAPRVNAVSILRPVSGSGFLDGPPGLGAQKTVPSPRHRRNAAPYCEVGLDAVELRMHQANCVRHARDCSDEGCSCSTTVRWSVFMLRSLNIRREVQPTGSRRMTGNFLEVFFWYS